MGTNEWSVNGLGRLTAANSGGGACSPTALVQLVETGDVVGAHLGGAPEAEVRVTPGDDGWAAVFGEGVPDGGHGQELASPTDEISHTNHE